jgi:cytochrome c oxidase subunit IV
MTIGAGIFLIAVGAILKFATNFHVQGVSIDTIGVILMIAGAAGLILGFFHEAIWTDRARRREAAATERQEAAAAAEERRAPPPPRY